MLPEQYCNGDAESEEKQRGREGQKWAEGTDKGLRGKECDGRVSMYSAQNPSRSRRALKDRGDEGESTQEREAYECPLQMEKDYRKKRGIPSKSKGSPQKFREPKSVIKWLSKYRVTYLPVCWILKKDLLDEGAKEEINKCGLIEDWPFWRYINQVHDLRYVFVEKPILLYRRGHNSISTPNSQYASRFYSDYREICKRYSVGEGLLGKYILKLNQAMIVPKLSFHKYFDPIKYYMHLYYIFNYHEIKRVEGLTQKKYIKCNQELLDKIEKDTEFIYGDLIEETC